VVNALEGEKLFRGAPMTWEEKDRKRIMAKIKILPEQKRRLATLFISPPNKENKMH
jgi:hypothetical protein